VLGSTTRIAPTPQDLHIRWIKQDRSIIWQKASGYNRRSKVELATARYKRVIREALRSCDDARLLYEAKIAVKALNRMLKFTHPICVHVA